MASPAYHQLSYDSELAPLIRQLTALDFSPEGIQQMRARSGNPKKYLDNSLDPTKRKSISKDEITIAGSPHIILSVLTKIGGATGRFKPCLYDIHDCGYAGHRVINIDLLLPIVVEQDVIVISPEYRLAPENPSPAALSDCFAGLVFVAGHAAALGIAADKIGRRCCSEPKFPLSDVLGGPSPPLSYLKEETKHCFTSYIPSELGNADSENI